MVKIEEILDFPKESKRDKKIFKEKIYLNADVKNKDKIIFIENIQEIRWIYALKEEYVRIFKKIDKERNYSEIDFINVILKKEIKKLGDLKRIAEIILRYIYNPIVLSFEYENKINLLLSHKKNHGTDNKRSVIDSNLFSTNWIDLDNQDKIDKYLISSLKLENLKSRDFYEFYNKIIDNILLFNASKNVGKLLTPTIEYDSNNLFKLSENYLNNKNLIEKYDKILNKENNPKKIINFNEKRTNLLNKQKNIAKILNC